MDQCYKYYQQSQQTCGLSDFCLIVKRYMIRLNKYFVGFFSGLLYTYYRFIVRFPRVLDFLFITFTFFIHFLLSWTSSLSISCSAISASTLSNHVFLCLPTGLLSSTLYSIHLFTQSSSPFLITCPYHLSLPLLMKVVILSFNEIHVHMGYVDT